VEDGGFGYNGMGFEALVAEEEQGTNQMWGGNVEEQQLVYADFDAEENRWVDTELHAWGGSGEDSMELEISQEVMYQPTGGTMSTAISSTATIENPSHSTDEGPAIENAEEPSSSDAPLTSASNDTTSAEEWHCDFPNCERSFTHQHKLKYVHVVPNISFNKLTRPSRHRKYHIKPYRCLDPLCSSLHKAFSLRKDLIRHQASHTGRRFYCQHTGCSYSISAPGGGFTRKDNLKRHIMNRH